MKMKLFRLAAWAMAMTAAHLTAQTFTTLYNFPQVNSDDENIYGAFPHPRPTLSGNTLYGTALRGGLNGDGTVYKVNTNGTGMTRLHSFTGGNDGANPEDVLLLSGNTLYGTANNGGLYGSGTVFAVNSNGTGFTNLHSFTEPLGTNGGYGTNRDGAYPWAGLILSGNTLYGTANRGGLYGSGTLFAVNADGTDFTNLHSFTAPLGIGGADGTNYDGAFPIFGLLLSGTTLYGTANSGGTNGYGTVFALNADGTGFTNLHSFTEPLGTEGGYGTNSDGAYPWGGLIQSGNTLYGTTPVGGSNGTGTVFAVNTDGTGFTTLYSFTSGSGSYSDTTNSDGAFPICTLLLSGNTLYGEANSGGSSGNGTVFALSTNGTGFTNLHSFTTLGTEGGYETNSDGAFPWTGLILSGNSLYGTAKSGGLHGSGTVFSVTLPVPQLSITASGTNVIMTWPTNAAGISFAGYTLQSTLNLGATAAWNPVSPPPVVVNGQYFVTNPISGTQQFYQLSQ
jgi:uncharacterized repeat protein (TIGR03803 family)